MSTPPGIGAGDHVRGSGPEAIVYLDLGCAGCAAAWPLIAELELRLCVRHFPIAAKHPRAPALHAAAEAAGRQREDAFWAMWDEAYRDQGHQDDPHLWQRARSLGLDLERFERDRRSAEVEARIGRDFDSGRAAGIASTPALIDAGEAVTDDVTRRLEERAGLGPA